MHIITFGSCGPRALRSGGNCLSPTYISDWLFSESRHLARYFPANMPWPMTLAPTNGAIRREFQRKKNLNRKKNLPPRIWEVIWMYGYLYITKHKIGESRRLLHILFFLSCFIPILGLFPLYKVLLSGY